MAARRKPAAPAPTASWSTLAEVPVGHYATLADGREVRVATTIGGAVFVRLKSCEPRFGPLEMPGDTTVRSTRAPDLAPVDRTAVADPLAGAAREPDLLRREGA
jgi:hypothetical protein